MHIGLVSYEYPPQQGLGGVGTYMFRLAGALGRAGHQVHVITGPSDRPPVPQPNVLLHRTGAVYQPEHAGRAARWFYWQVVARALGRINAPIWHWIKWDLAARKAIREVDSACGLDLVEAPEHAGNGWAAGQVHRWPLLIRMHCPWDLFTRINRIAFNPVNRLLSALERRSISHDADCITAPSAAMQRLVAQSWQPRRPVRVLPNFMDVPARPMPLPEEDRPQRIVATGRIEPLKGQDTLARAFALIAARCPRAELWIIGPDRWSAKHSFRDLLARLVPDPAVRARIHLPGQVPLQEVKDHLQAARLAVVASVGFESFSFSALEAMATARPVIATATGALPELISHEQTGLIVPPHDPSALAAAMERMLGDRPFSQQCALAAHTAARERYDTTRVLPEVLKAYEEAADYYYGCPRLWPAGEWWAAPVEEASIPADPGLANGKLRDHAPPVPKAPRGGRAKPRPQKASGERLKPVG